MAHLAFFYNEPLDIERIFRLPILIIIREHNGDAQTLTTAFTKIIAMSLRNDPANQMKFCILSTLSSSLSYENTNSVLATPEIWTCRRCLSPASFASSGGCVASSFTALTIWAQLGQSK